MKTTKSGERYNHWHYTKNNKRFYLSHYLPNIEECKFILLKVVEQAIRDYSHLIKFKDSEELYIKWEEAKDFLFDEDYFIQWGNIELSLELITDILELDLDWIRMKAKKLYKEKNG